MLDETKKLPSGAELRLQVPPFGVASRLYKTASRVLLSVKIDVALSPAAIAQLFEKDVPVNDLKNVLLSLVASDELELVLWECMGRCLYNGLRIDPKVTFEDEKAREDYFPIAWEVLRFALRPFFKSLPFGSLTHAPATGNAPQ